MNEIDPRTRIVRNYGDKPRAEMLEDTPLWFGTEVSERCFPTESQQASGLTCPVPAMLHGLFLFRQPGPHLKQSTC